MEFVFNEWFLNWHSPLEATPEQRKTVHRIINWLIGQQDHRLVVMNRSPFMDKLNLFRKDFDYDPFCRNSLKTFYAQIIINLTICRQVEKPPQLPPDIEELLQRPTEPPFTNIESDRYLFESAETTHEKIIITTDEKLIGHFAQSERFRLWTVDDFLKKLNIP